jgi:hypothetical protein
VALTSRNDSRYVAGRANCHDTMATSHRAATTMGESSGRIPAEAGTVEGYRPLSSNIAGLTPAQLHLAKKPNRFDKENSKPPKRG